MAFPFITLLLRFPLRIQACLFTVIKAEVLYTYSLSTV